MSQDLLAALVPVLPLAGAIILASLRRNLSANVAGGLATALIAGSFVLSVLLLRKQER